MPEVLWELKGVLILRPNASRWYACREATRAFACCRAERRDFLRLSGKSVMLFVELCEGVDSPSPLPRRVFLSEDLVIETRMPLAT